MNVLVCQFRSNVAVVFLALRLIIMMMMMMMMMNFP